MRSVVVRMVVSCVMLAGVLGVGVTPALADAPWWHLSSSARPSYLHAQTGLAPAQDEVQELDVAPGSAFYLTVDHQGVGPAEGLFETEPDPYSGAFPQLTAEVLQPALEAVYGAHNVLVTGGPGGILPLTVTSVDGDAEKAVPPLEVVEVFNGSATASVVTPGRSPQSDGHIIASVLNVGDANASGTVRVLDRPPAGLRAVEVEGVIALGSNKLPLECSLESEGAKEPAVAVCTVTPAEEPTGRLVPFDRIEVRVGVVVGEHASSGEENEVSVTGGGASPARIRHKITVSSEPPPFGVEDYELTPEEEGGGVDTQAGSHPFQTTFTIDLNQGPQADSRGQVSAYPVGMARDLNVKLPPGLIGDPVPFPRCTSAEFLAAVNGCPAGSIVGVAAVTVSEPEYLGLSTVSVPVFNLEPSPGEPARFGFLPILGRETPVYIDSSVRSGGDYGITGEVRNITQTAEFLASVVTFWGVPGDPRHNDQRGEGCLQGGGACAGNELDQFNPPPFFELPASCTGPLQSSVETDSWENPGVFTSAAAQPMPALDGCNHLPFTPEIRVTPDGQAASTPTGLTVDVHVPQEETLNPKGLGEGEPKNISVTLPEGLVLNPSDADGLQACSRQQVGFTGFKELNPESEPGVSTPQFEPEVYNPETKQHEATLCPNASKIATATITTPLLPVNQPLKGEVYLAAPQNFSGMPQENPFSSLVAMYIVARDPVSGVLVKLAGSVSLNETTGQITATFENSPQAPFEDAQLEFFGGERAPLGTPAMCATYTTNASLTSWSSDEPFGSSSSFDITSGPDTTEHPNGTPCPGSSLPFSPTLTSGSTNINAGGFSPLTTTISREDGNQDIQSVTLHYPPGMSGILAGVPLCPEAQANAGTCSPESEIGETIVSVGLGGDPFTVTGGKAYLTEKYDGAPFGLSIVNPAKAGPFNLQEGRPVVVRAKIEINPITAALTITTGNIPHIIDGFPLEIKHVNVLVNRPKFTINPTNCDPQEITGTITSDEDASSPVAVPFQATNCAALKFEPKVAVSTAGKASKADGASLFFKIAYPKGAQGSDSWFSEAKFDLPKQLPARLTTLQKACLAATFQASEAACPPASLIGHAVVHTQVLPVPLEGPVYFVSYGGAKFPEAVIVLKGDGITVDLHGETFISKAGITSATFRSTPDVPFESIEVSIPTGPFSEFGANLPAKDKYSFCGQSLTMPTLFKAQNGLEIHQNTPITVTGCKTTTRTQKLAAALKACHKDKNKKNRTTCETRARKKYATNKNKKK